MLDEPRRVTVLIPSLRQSTGTGTGRARLLVFAKPPCGFLSECRRNVGVDDARHERTAFGTARVSRVEEVEPT